MEDFNIVPSTGTFGNAMGVVNQNFELAKEQIDKVSKMKENSLGMFASRENLVSAYPSPQKGQFAYVGNSEPFAIYKCVTDGEWPSTSSGTWDGGTIDLNDFATKETTDTLFANMKYFSVPQSAFNNGVITLTIEGYKLFVGGAIKLKMGFVLSSGVGVKMNINNTGEKALYYNGSNTSSINSWKQNEIIEVFYDGEKFMAYKLFDRKILDSISDSLSESFDVSTIGAVVNFVNTKLSRGYLYAGIATPSSTPTTGKVFYLALTSGTYTKFGNIAVTQGINILKYNGSAWSLDAFVGIDDTPTPQSNELVKSGGVFNDIMTNGSAFDLTAYNNGTTYEDLNAALTALNALPAAYKKGGMSMKFVRTSDNKYVQCRLMANAFTTDITQWQVVEDEPIYGSENLVNGKGIIDSTMEVLPVVKYKGTSLSGWNTLGSYRVRKGCKYLLQAKIPSALASMKYFIFATTPTKETGLSFDIAAGDTESAIVTFNATEDATMYIRSYGNIPSVEITVKNTFNLMLQKNIYPTVFFSTGSILFDNTNQRITCNAKIETNINGDKTTIPANTSINYSDYESILTNTKSALVCDKANSTFKIVNFNNITNEDAIIASIGGVSVSDGNITILFISFSSVAYSINPDTTIDDTVKQNGSKPVKGSGIYTAINNSATTLNANIAKAVQQKLTAFYTQGKIIIDNTNQQIRCTANVVTKIDGVEYKILANTIMNYSDYISPLTDAISCLVFDKTNNTFKVVTWKNAMNELIILVFGSVSYSNNVVTINNVGFSSVSYEITPGEVYPNMYYGEKISFNNNLYKMNRYKNIGLNWNQSCVCYNNYFLSFENQNNTIRLYNLENNNLLMTENIPHGTYDAPHCNTACLGNTLYSEHSIMPLVYVSQWNVNEQRACFVYDITYENSSYSVTLVQVINLASVSNNIIGAGTCDFAVFDDKLFAVSYKLNSSYYENGSNRTLLNVFALPSTADNEVILTDNEVLITKEFPLIYMRQDLHVDNGNIYIAGGGNDNDEQRAERKITVINTISLNISSIVPLTNFQGEPEGLTTYNGELIITASDGILYKIEFK